MSIDRPNDFWHNADLRTLAVSVNQLIDAVEELQKQGKTKEKKAPAKK